MQRLPQTFGYDGASRLTSVMGGPATETGRSYARAYQYDARDNRTKTSFDLQSDGGTACSVDHLAMGGANQVDTPWRDGNATCGDNSPRFYSPDQDGRVGSLTNGSGAWQLDFVYTSASGQAGLESVFKQVSIRQCSTCAGATWTYYYDAFNRRRYKQSPVGGAQEFFYDNQQTLLTDRVGDVDGPSPSYLVVDDYVWLGGRAVAMLRGRMTTGYVRQADTSAACNRAGSPSPCGRYHLVTDWQGKPIATLDGAGKVAGYVEYEPHGFTNRAYVAKTVVGPTVAPYNTVFPVVTTSTVGASTAISAANSEVVSGRALLFNTDLSLINCPNAGQVLLNGTTALTQKGLPLKWAWTNWVQLTPTTPTTASGGQSATVTAKGDCSASPTVTPYYVEFRRAQKAVPHVFVPLRAPGQYFDEETDLFENWNRYYDPFKGVYLQPEPMLEQPAWINSEAQVGRGVPTFSYANSNPVSNIDPTGLYSVEGNCGSTLPTLDETRRILNARRSNEPSSSRMAIH